MPDYGDCRTVDVDASPRACFEGDFRDFSGEWRFLDRDGGGTRVELDLRIDPGRFVPGPLRSAVSDAVMRRALADLKAHVEGGRRVSS